MKKGHIVTPLRERFWAKVARGGSIDCWEWQGHLTPKGYGQIYTGTYIDGRRCIKGAHRVAWELQRGDIPAGMQVCHICDNPSCVNPAHLFLGTQKDNMQDMSCKGRGANQGRLSKRCALCNTIFLVKPSHFDKRTYCSRHCMGLAYRQRMRDSGNPNYRHGLRVQNA